MKRDLAYRCIVWGWLFAALLLFSCEKEKEPDRPNPPMPVTAERTVLAYMLAENSLSSFAAEDIREMTEGMEQVSGNASNLMVYVDDYQSPRLLKIRKDAVTGRVEQEILQEYEEQNSIDPDVMHEVFKKAFTACPAKSYGLILWSHGEGWLPYPLTSRRPLSFGQDGGASGPMMNISDLENVLSRSLSLINPAQGFDFILFDACFMQSVEVAYQLRNYTRYLIGSPIEIPGPGAPYHKLTEFCFADPLDAAAIGRAYYDYYTQEENYPIAGWYKPYGVAVSVIRTDELEELGRRTAVLLPSYASVLEDFDVSSVQCFDMRSNRAAYYDLGDFMKHLVTRPEYDLWEEQLRKAVPYAASTAECYSAFTQRTFPMKAYSGISTYIPRNRVGIFAYWNEFYRTYGWYRAAGWDLAGW